MSRTTANIVHQESGIALFIVIWVLVLLSVIVGEFCYSMRTELNLTRNFKEETQGYYIALAGVNKAIYELLIKEYNSHPLENNSNIWRVNVKTPEIAFNNGDYQVQIDNESGKININQAEGPLIWMILGRLGLEKKKKEIIIDSIKDWRDEDSFHRINGAEDDYYENQAEPYSCKDAQFDSPVELLYVRGITKEIYYGGLDKICSVYGKIDFNADNITSDRNNLINEQTFDYSKININAASKDMLLCFPDMTETVADEIIAYRQTKDFRYLAELLKIVDNDLYRKMFHYITLDMTAYYRITSTGKISGSDNEGKVIVLIQLDNGTEKGYRILEWHEC